MSNHSSNRPSVHVVGGGIGGLTAALALVRSGHDVVVSEQAPRLSEVGAGITLWPNAFRVLVALGLGARILDAGHCHDKTVIANDRGRRLVTRTFPPEARLVGIHRARLQEILHDALPPSTVRFDRRVQRLEQDERGVTVEFDSGDHTSSELVVGADGIHSAVRKSAFAAGVARYHGYTAFRGLLDDWPGRQPITGELLGRGRRFGIWPIGNGQLYWYATSNQPEHRIVDVADRRAFVSDRFDGWAFDVPTIVARTETADILQHDVGDLAPTSGWSNGRVVLMGDAIHPTSPNLGQGAAMAIEDAMVLSRCLGRVDDPLEAFAGFEKARADRTAKVAMLSKRIGDLGQSDRMVICAVRNQAMRLVSNSMATRQSRWLTDYDAFTTELPVPRRSVGPRKAAHP